MATLPVVDVVGVGLNATDTLIHVPQFPARGGKLEYERELLQPGGQVASAMVACQTWGLKTRYVGKLGDDAAAALHTKAFADAGVECHVTHVAGAPSAKSLILVDGEGERTVLCRRDERMRLQPEHLRREWVTAAHALLVDGHDTEAAALAAEWAHASGVPVTADLDEVYEDVEALLANVDYLIVSKDLPPRLTGETQIEPALQLMQRRFGCRLTAATLGTDGVLAWDGEAFHHAAAYRVPAVDTTGAGDIFHAGFVFALLRNWTLAQQLDFACAAAAMNCMGQGARGGIRTLVEIQHLMATGERYSHRRDHTA